MTEENENKDKEPIYKTGRRETPLTDLFDEVVKAYEWDNSNTQNNQNKNKKDNSQ